MLPLFFAFIGLFFFGFRGFLFGALLAYAIRFGLRFLLRSGLHQVRSQFTDSIFAVVGALSKADGVVTPDEIRATEELFVRFQLNEEQTKSAKAAFHRGKSQDFDLESEVLRFKLITKSNPVLLQLFLDVLLRIVAADGVIHSAERQMLLQIARILGLGERDLSQLEALLRSTGTRPAERHVPSSAQTLNDAYTALGVSPQASDTELKRAYRKLVVQNHPDKLAAKGVPPGVLEMAETRTREINDAYTLLKKSRGLS